MNPRRMESLVPLPEDRREACRILFGGEPGAVLAISWPEPEALAGQASLVEVPTIRDAARNPYPAVLWSVQGDAPSPSAVLQVRGLLEDRGRLVLRWATKGELGQEEAVRATRRLVRSLSESGFSILRELPPEELGGPAVIARRDEFVVRSYREEDDDAIRTLFEESFPHSRRSPEHWRWKYHDNPWGNRLISLATAPEGQLAVHYAGYPVPVWCRGRELRALHMGDTMSAWAYRRVGRGSSSLLARTVRHFFARHRGGPFTFYFGFNTGPIQRFCRWFIGGAQVESVAYRRCELTPGPGWSMRGYRVARVDELSAAWDRLFRRVAPRYRFLVRRDREYVRWRYLDCPDAAFVVLEARRFGRLVGWGVFRREDGVLLWGDALVDPRHPRAAEALLAGALREPDLAGAQVVEGWFPPRPSWWHQELVALGLDLQPHPQGLGLMLLLDQEKGAPPPFEELYYAMGDGDLF